VVGGGRSIAAPASPLGSNNKIAPHPRVSTAPPPPAPPPTLTWTASWVSQGGVDPCLAAASLAGTKPNQDSFIVEDAWWCPGAQGLVGGGGGSSGSNLAQPSTHHRRSLSAFAGGASSAAAASARPTPTMAPNPLALYAAFDGHGPRGHTVSDLARRRFPPALAASLARGAGAGAGAGHRPGAALADALLAVDRDLMAGPCRACGVSGTTAVVALVTARPPALHVAWVGDSRAVLARRRVVEMEGDGQTALEDGRWSLRGATATPRAAACATPTAAAATARPPSTTPTTPAPWVAAPAGLDAIDLTRDHKPSDPAERARIEATGGRVQRLVDPDTGAEVGPARVWLATAWAPGLAMSRSLGDALARSVGVLPAANTASAGITAADAFAIIATDGVWEFMSGADAVGVVARAPSPAAGCTALVTEARRRWGVEEASGSVDDITAIVVSLDVAAAAAARAEGGGLDRAGST